MRTAAAVKELTVTGSSRSPSPTTGGAPVLLSYFLVRSQDTCSLLETVRIAPNYRCLLGRFLSCIEHRRRSGRIMYVKWVTRDCYSYNMTSRNIWVCLSGEGEDDTSCTDARLEIAGNSTREHHALHWTLKSKKTRCEEVRQRKEEYLLMLANCACFSSKWDIRGWKRSAYFGCVTFDVSNQHDWNGKLQL